MKAMNAKAIIESSRSQVIHGCLFKAPGSTGTARASGRISDAHLIAATGHLPAAAVPTHPYRPPMSFRSDTSPMQMISVVALRLKSRSAHPDPPPDVPRRRSGPAGQRRYYQLVGLSPTITDTTLISPAVTVSGPKYSNISPMPPTIRVIPMSASATFGRWPGGDLGGEHYHCE